MQPTMRQRALVLSSAGPLLGGAMLASEVLSFGHPIYGPARFVATALIISPVFLQLVAYLRRSRDGLAIGVVVMSVGTAALGIWGWLVGIAGAFVVIWFFALAFDPGWQNATQSWLEAISFCAAVGALFWKLAGRPLRR